MEFFGLTRCICRRNARCSTERYFFFFKMTPPPPNSPLSPHPPLSRPPGDAGGESDANPAVAVEIRGIRPVQLEALLVRDEHRHARAVLAGVEDLFRLVPRRIEVDG